jgi:hypothetical protein
MADRNEKGTSNRKAGHNHDIAPDTSKSISCKSPSGRQLSATLAGPFEVGFRPNLVPGEVQELTNQLIGSCHSYLVCADLSVESPNENGTGSSTAKNTTEMTRNPIPRAIWDRLLSELRLVNTRHRSLWIFTRHLASFPRITPSGADARLVRLCALRIAAESEDEAVVGAALFDLVGVLAEILADPRESAQRRSRAQELLQSTLSDLHERTPSPCASFQPTLWMMATADWVTARDMTREERMAGDRRRAFTPAELSRLFKSQLFTNPDDHSEEAAGWFLAIAALTGARTEEIALAPAKLVLVGDIHCLDLREAGRKTSAAPRLVPLLPDLLKMGLPDWANRQAARGYSPVQPGLEQRSAAAWSKWLNRYLNAKVSDDPRLVLYSLRHGFRQMLRAGNIGDELADKIFGHSNGKVGAGYGRDLSSDEALLFVTSVRPPVDLHHLWRSL